jgi:hypothetical protein
MKIHSAVLVLLHADKHTDSRTDTDMAKLRCLTTTLCCERAKKMRFFTNIGQLKKSLEADLSVRH